MVLVLVECGDSGEGRACWLRAKSKVVVAGMRLSSKTRTSLDAVWQYAR